LGFGGLSYGHASDFALRANGQYALYDSEANTAPTPTASKA
jgi:hypothetical protein